VIVAPSVLHVVNLISVNRVRIAVNAMIAPIVRIAVRVMTVLNALIALRVKTVPIVKIVSGVRIVLGVLDSLIRPVRETSRHLRNNLKQ
jgi:hypothetical protein